MKIGLCPCGKEIAIPNHLINRKKYCSQDCKYKYRVRPSGLKYNIRVVNKAWYKKGQMSGDKHHNWKGGRSSTGNGYLLVYRPKHPNCDHDGYVLEHRYIMEQSIGRYLNPNEIIHHINENRKDNRIENLIIFNGNVEHMRFHRMQRSI